MIIYKTEAEIELIKESSLLVSATLTQVAQFLRAGVTTLQVNELVETFIRDNGATPSFKNYNGFPYSACCSVNDAVVHGFPDNTELKDGDVVSVDVGVYKNSFHGDSAYTFIIGEAKPEVKKLLQVTKESLLLGCAKAIHGNRVGDIAFAVQEHTERKNKYGVVRQLVGHGLGKDLHEDPQVPNFGKRGQGSILREGTVIAIEPMINMGKADVYTDDDNWTIRTKDGLLSAHFEHTVCVRKLQPQILSSFQGIEAAEKANINLG
jgi:methionyl aminopeptidase